MASKNKPGKFDCYANADPDEPMFVLLGRDPLASALVRLWAGARERMPGGEDPEKLAEARACAKALEAWAVAKGKGEGVHAAREALSQWNLTEPAVQIGLLRSWLTLMTELTTSPPGAR